MLPLRDVIPSRRAPVVTVALIATNTIVWLHEASLDARALEDFVRRFGLVPADGRPVAYLTSMFLHGGWLHLVGNMLYLWVFGDNVEDRLGRGRFLGFYLGCGVMAAVVQVLAQPASTVPIVGASGAVAGVLGAYLVLFPRSRVLTLVPIVVIVRLVEIPAVFFLGVWFVLQVAGGLQTAPTAAAGGIAFWAHVAGFLAGVVGILVLGGRRRRSSYWTES
jgi:membrane associated rhomboid family serine protease